MNYRYDTKSKATRWIVRFSVIFVLAALLTGMLLADNDWRSEEDDLLFLDDFTVAPIPEITSVPPLSADLGTLYHYQVEASDPQNYPLNYRLLASPEGMTIDRRSGLIQWQIDQTGAFSVELQVRNPRGGLATQKFTLTVESSDALVILSSPVTLIAEGEQFSYQLIVQDPNDLPLSFSLLEGPSGMTIDNESGRIDWHSAEAGSYDVVWRVVNTIGQQAEQSFVLQVAEISEIGRLLGQASGIGDGTITIRESNTGQTRTLANYAIFSIDVLIGEQYQIEITDQSADPEQTCIIDNATGVMSEMDPWPVIVTCLPQVSDIDDLIGDAHEEFESDLPPTTPEELEASEFGQNQMSPADRARLNRAHALVMSAIDPDPEWVSTGQSHNVVVAEPGQTYHVDLRRMNFEGMDIGPVPSEFLRLEIRVQRDGYGFDWIHENLGAHIARWSEGEPGRIEITVPEDLDRGRVIIGIRPDFFDPGQRAISERWSTAVLLEVWPLKPGVTTLDADTVLFPSDVELEYFPEDGEFNMEDVWAGVEQFLSDDDFVLPLLLSNLNGLVVGDLFDYRLQGQVYSGRVAEVQSRNGEHLVLARPEWLDIYDVAEADDDFLVNLGVVPDHVVYRVGEPVEGFDAPWRGDRLVLETADEELDAQDRIVYPTQRSMDRAFPDWFLPECERGSASLTFSPKFSLEPFDAGLEVTVGAGAGDAVECKWKSSNKPITVNFARFGGPLVLLLGELVGTNLETLPYGEIGFKAGSEGAVIPLISGFKSGFSVRRGGYFDAGLPFVSDFSDLAAGTPVLVAVEGVVGAGVKEKLNVVSSSGWIGRLIRRFTPSGEYRIGLEAQVGLEMAAVLEGANAPAVYQLNKESRGAATAGIVVRLSASQVLKSLFKFLGGQGDLAVNVGGSAEMFRFAGEFSAGNVQDDGLGNARVADLTSKFVLPAFLAGAPAGRIGPQNQSSSIFNDDHLNVSYELAECESSPTSRITAPVIACTGFFCGRTNTVDFCGGELWISPLNASGVVGETVSTNGEVGVTARAGSTESVVASVSGQPLVPQGSPFVIPPGDSRTFAATANCASKGAHRGSVTATSSGQGLETENTNLLTCRCKPGTPDCDRTWGSPHLVTADRLAYDYYASGDYILQHIPGVPGIEVQGRFLPGFGVSWPQAVAMQVGPDVVEIHGDRLLTGFGNSHLLHVWVNGERVADVHQWRPFENNRYLPLPGGGGIYFEQFLRRFGGGLVDPIALTVHWPQGGGTEGYGVRVAGLAFDQNDSSAFRDNPPMIEITLMRPEVPAGPERGMLGTHDGDPSTDLTRRNGQVIDFSENLTWTELYALFGGDWLARPNECLFRNGCIVPEFPESPVLLSPEQRLMAEVACHGLTGWYFEACVHDVGLLGSTGLVETLYANTEDLNHMASQIVRPGVDLPVFQLIPGDVEQNGEYQRFYFEVDQVSGEGQFLLTVRPPNGATAVLDGGEGSHVDSASLAGWVDVQSCLVHPDWLELGEGWPATGSLQLWAIDPLSGIAGVLLGQMDIPDLSGDDRCVNLIENVHSASGSPAVVHLFSEATEDTRVRLAPAPGIDFEVDATEERLICAGCNISIDTGYICPAGRQALGRLKISTLNGQLREVRDLTCQTITTQLARHFAAGMWSGFGLAESLLVTEDNTLWSLSRGASAPIDLTRRQGGFPKPIHDGLFDQPIRQVGTGERHSVVLLENGQLWSWGHNAAGQLGNGTLVNSDTPVPVGLSAFEYPIVQLSVGRSFSLALDTAGQLWCWGANSCGQPDDWIHSTPVKIEVSGAGENRISAMSAGHEFSMALDVQGRLWTWGRNTEGQLGDGTLFNRQSPINVDLTGLGAGNVVSIVAGGHHALLLDDQGGLWTWGNNNSGQLGRLPTGAGHLELRRPARMNLDFLDGEQLLWVTADSDIATRRREFNVALDTAGRMWAWGANQYGQLGIGDEETNYFVTPTQMDFSGLDSAAIEYAALGGAYGYAVDSMHRVWGWGHNSGSKLGDTTSITRSSPVLIGDMSLAGLQVEIEQLDQPTALPLGSAKPVTIAVADAYNRVFTSLDVELQILTPGVYYAGTESQAEEFDRFTRTRRGLSVLPTDVCTAYGDHTVTIELSHAELGVVAQAEVLVRCVPDVRFELAVGHGSTEISIENASNEELMLQLEGHRDIQIESQQILEVSLCAQCIENLTADMACSALGGMPLAKAQVLDAETNLLNEVSLDCQLIRQRVAVVGNGSFAFDGESYWGWGSNARGLLGIGTIGGGGSLPILLDRTMLSSGSPRLFSTNGSQHVQVIDSAGQIWGWGANRYGQLGNNNHFSQFSNGVPGFVSDQLGPIPIEGALSDSSLQVHAAGAEFSLGLDMAGRVWAWGRNYGHESLLGDATAVDQPFPIPVAIPIQAKAIAAGFYFSLALSPDGLTLWSWGGNCCGQLGIGETWPTQGSGYEDRFYWPVEVDTDFLGGASIETIAAGGVHALAMDSLGRVWAWGRNDSGQLGTGDTDSRFEPSLVDLGPLDEARVIGIAAGGSRSFAEDELGRIWAWGSNFSGQLGIGTDDPMALLPTELDLSGLNGATIVDFATGRDHSLFLDSSDCYWAWGKNDWGQLGDGTTENRNAPTLVENISGVCEQ